MVHGAAANPPRLDRGPVCTGILHERGRRRERRTATSRAHHSLRLVKPLRFPCGPSGSQLERHDERPRRRRRPPARALCLLMIVEEGLDTDILCEEVAAIVEASNEAGPVVSGTPRSSSGAKPMGCTSRRPAGERATRERPATEGETWRPRSGLPEPSATTARQSCWHGASRAGGRHRGGHDGAVADRRVPARGTRAHLRGMRDPTRGGRGDGAQVGRRAAWRGPARGRCTCPSRRGRQASPGDRPDAVANEGKLVAFVAPESGVGRAGGDEGGPREGRTPP